MGPLGGFLAALGHMVVELPYVLLLYRFTSTLRSFIGRFKYALNIVVVLFLLYFSYMLLRDSISIAMGLGGSQGSASIAGGGLLGAVVTGALLTGFNAYFLLWWLTVGYPLIEESSKLGLRGFTVMYVSHVWMDFAWLTLLAGGGDAVRLLGSTPYAILLGVLAAILVVFSIKIAVTTFKDMTAVPRAG
jgi:threonine/homoserine/homoserine lactone efflux protein